MTNQELAIKARELKELKQMAEEVAEEITSIEDAIKAEMTARNTEEIQTGIFNIRWATIRNSRFDSKAFKSAMPELHAKFLKQTESRRFSVVC